MYIVQLQSDTLKRNVETDMPIKTKRLKILFHIQVVELLSTVVRAFAAMLLWLQAFLISWSLCGSKMVFSLDLTKNLTIIYDLSPDCQARQVEYQGLKSHSELQLMLLGITFLFIQVRPFLKSCSDVSSSLQ